MTIICKRTSKPLDARAPSLVVMSGHNRLQRGRDADPNSRFAAVAVISVQVVQSGPRLSCIINDNYFRSELQAKLRAYGACGHTSGNVLFMTSFTEKFAGKNNTTVY